MRKTLISHFYNEEYLLPWWLMHHTKIFDHGILINRGSTDRSVEICKLFAPHWEVRDSRFLEFDPTNTDIEVMEIEREVSGWKMVLNTTEFLCCNNVEEFFSSLHTLGQNMYAIRMIVMIDKHDYNYSKLRYSIPLVEQRYHGLFPYKPESAVPGDLYTTILMVHIYQADILLGTNLSFITLLHSFSNFILALGTNIQRQENYKLHPPFQKGRSNGTSKQYGRSSEELEARF